MERRSKVMRILYVYVYMQGWGLTVVLGIHATPKMVPLHPMELFDGRRITGCVFGDVKGKSQLPAIVDKCINGVSHTLP